MNQPRRDAGFTLVETMVAASIAGIAFVGTMGAVELASRLAMQASLIDKASGTAQSRLEVKRSVGWRTMVEDDLDHDGVPETEMNDAGVGGDTIAGDGIYTASTEVDGLTEVWTIHVGHPGPLASVGLVALTSTVTYRGPNGTRHIQMETLRANPMYLGAKQS